MDDLTKTQLIWLVLLVSFVTSLSTVVLTLSLVDQAPHTSPQTILQRVVERVSSLGEITAPQILSPDKNIIVISEEQMVIAVAEEASPAVVSIIASRDLPRLENIFLDPFTGLFLDRDNTLEKREVGRGSGFLISSSGTIITNRHVVADSDAEYTVILNTGIAYQATVKARDPIHDIAILSIDANNLPFIPLGDSSSVKIGQSVVAIGNSLGQFQNTVSVGIISGVGRTVTSNSIISGPTDLQQVLQTDAAINPGNSGGPLLNLQGEVIGINTAVIAGAENISFAIPAHIAARDVAQLESIGRITYPYLGVRYMILNETIANEQNLAVFNGAFITTQGTSQTAVIPGSPADRAGLREGDVIIAVNDIPLTQLTHLAELIQEKNVGETITLIVQRKNKILEFSVTLDELP